MLKYTISFKQIAGSHVVLQRKLVSEWKYNRESKLHDLWQKTSFLKLKP